MADLAPATAIVLAGGRSARFGANKLAADVEGQPLLHRAIRVAALVCDELVVVGTPTGLPTSLPADLTPAPLTVLDEVAFPGPLMALAGAMDASHRSRLLLVAGDMPDLVPSILRRVLRWAPGRQGACLVADGIDQPFPMGLDRDAARARAGELLAQDRRSLRALVDSLDLERVSEEDWRELDPHARSLRDIDRPEDLG